jgi:UDP-N-acetylmuramoyl-tripeptide--D-alanyl-D-alanine ligase
MKLLKLNDILKVLRLEIGNENSVIKNVKIDIKDIGDDTLVFHLNKDVELDLNQFKKVKNCFVITDQPLISEMLPYKDSFIFVTHVKKAYDAFKNYYRNLFDLPVVAITGTCGKTTTKEMIVQVLRQKYQVAATNSNINALRFNHSYLMDIDDQTDYGVFETAISYPGDLIYGCEYFKPTIGVITTIGVDHLNGCKTLNNYIRTKGEMLVGLNYQGTLILNADDTNTKKIDLSSYKGKLIQFGIKKEADFKAIDIAYNEHGMAFSVIYKETTYPAFLPVFGEHNVYNALAALAVLTELGYDLVEAIEGLQNFVPIRSHLAPHKGYNGSFILDDTWSSNPTSMKAAFEVLSELGKEKVKIAVIGKISYLGDFANHYYDEIAQMVKDYSIDLLITHDSFAKQIGKKAVELGVEAQRVIHCKNEKMVKETLEALMDENTLVLFKISMLDKSLTSMMKTLMVD